MIRGRKISKIKVFIPGIFMILTLAWLTVSLPMVNAAKQAIQSAKALSANNYNEKDTDNPFSGTTEEKSSSNSNSIVEEYLHDTHSSEHYIAVPSREYKVEHASIYIAFHGELISPPPDAC